MFVIKHNPKQSLFPNWLFIVLAVMIIYIVLAIITIAGTSFNLVRGQDPAKYRPLPIPNPYFPPEQPSGLDPIGMALNKSRIRIYELEQKLEVLQRITLAQHRQISQLQVYMFQSKPEEVVWSADRRSRLRIAERKALVPFVEPVPVPTSDLSKLLRDLDALKSPPGSIGSPAPIGSSGPGDQDAVEDR